jgi:ankyrin repeat protein
VEVAQLLISRGAEVDAAINAGETPLIGACSLGHVRAAQLLLDNGAAINHARIYFEFKKI